MLGLPFSCSGRAVPVVVRIFDDPSELKSGAEKKHERKYFLQAYPPEN
jgi:hypothetical protein